MAYTFFSKNCVWMHLMNYEEVELLKKLMTEFEFEGTILEVKKQEVPRLGNRITVVIRQPGCSEDSRVCYLRGENYHKWERIKSRIYQSRKKV